MKKNPALQDSPPGLGRFSDITPLRRSAFLPGGLFAAGLRSTSVSAKRVPPAYSTAKRTCKHAHLARCWQE